MADRSVIVKLGLDASGLVRGARSATTALQGVGKDGLSWVGRNEQSINQLSNTFGLVGIAAVGAAGLAVKSFADFDQQMSFVAATGDDAKNNLDALREAAIDAGQETAFSASEAAAGIEELAKAGISAEDILAGGLSGALDLAAAGGIEVADAAQTAATAMTQFELSGEDVVHVADLLAAGAGKAQGGVHELGMAMSQAGLVASQTGLSIEETIGGLTAFASAGLLGSDAGTSFKTMLQRLTPQSQEAADEMDRLGISAFDGQGNFIGLAGVAGELQTALADLSPEQRNAALSVIFGSDAVRAASVLYNEGEQGIRNWISAVDDQGFAAETAATRMDNLKGDVEQFVGSLETAFIGAGEGADGPLRKVVQTATDAVNAFNEMPDGVQTATLAIVGGGGLVALGVAGIGKLVVGISNTRDAMRNLGVATGRTGAAMRGLGKAVGLASGLLAVVSIIKAIDDATKEAATGIGEMTEALLNLRQGEVDTAISDLTDKLEKIENRNFFEGIVEGFDDLIHIGSEADVVAEEFDAIDQALVGLVQGGNIDAAEESVKALADQLGMSGDEVQALIDERFPGYLDALAQTRVDNELAAGGVDQTTGAFEEQETATEKATRQLEEYQDQLRAMTDPVFALESALTSVEDAQDAYNQAVEEYGKDSEEARDASFELARQLSGLEQAAIDGDLSFGDFDRKLRQWIESGAITEDQAADIRDRVGEARKAAEDYQGEYDAFLNADTSDARNDVIGFISWVNQRRATIQIRGQITNRQMFGADQFLAHGGLVQKFPGGGFVSGPGGPRDDKVNARLSNGEFVVQAPAVSMLGLGAMREINQGRLPGGGADDVTVNVMISRREIEGIAEVTVQRGNRMVRRQVLAGTGSVR